MFQVVVVEADGNESAEIDGKFVRNVNFFFCEIENGDVICVFRCGFSFADRKMPLE